VQLKVDVPLGAVVSEILPSAKSSNLQVSLPKSLYRDLCQRAQSESVGLDQLVTYILARGLEK